MTAPIIYKYLNVMIDKQASDLYLTVGFPPALRLKNKMAAIRPEPLTEQEMNELVNMVLTNRQRREFEQKNEMNSSLDMGKRGRFRINVLRQRANPAMVIRLIVSEIPSFEELRLPEFLKEICMEKRGLVLLTGMTGSGKSTTLASMIDYRNSNEQGHIITIEDPIEYYHDHKKSVITQREVGTDTESYAVAMKNALRQRPDAILVGEIRDREVMEQALTISETGHLCLATIHTNNSYQAIERIVNLFPEDYSQQIRQNLALNLKAIVSQRLVPAVHGGLTLAMEVMLNQGLVRDLIMKGEINKIKDIMEQSNAIGMCSYDQSLLKLFAEGMITEETAIAQSDQQGDMKIKVRQAKMTSGGDSFSGMDTSEIKMSE